MAKPRSELEIEGDETVLASRIWVFLPGCIEGAETESPILLYKVRDREHNAHCSAVIRLTDIHHFFIKP